MSPSRLMDCAFFANTTGTPKCRATTQAMPMPDASIVRIFVTGASANRRLNSAPMASNSSMSNWWFRKLSTFRTPSDFTTPSRLMRSSNCSTCRLRRPLSPSPEPPCAPPRARAKPLLDSVKDTPAVGNGSFARAAGKRDGSGRGVGRPHALRRQRGRCCPILPTARLGR